MMNIPMVDLKTQYHRVKNEIDRAILDVVENTAFINGPAVKEFQTGLEKYMDVKHVIPCANGTDALQIAMMALDLKPGDEVITTSFTFVATVEVIALLQLTPVLVDALPGTYNIDPAALEKAITPRTKAIVPVHLFGQCADMESILQIATKHHLAVIEDNCQAIGAYYTFSDGTRKQAGTMGHVGTTSFFPSKNLGCYGDGGAMFTNDDALAEKLRMISNHGMKVRYYHDSIGVNSRLDTIQAAVLNVKLAQLNDYIANRQRAAAYYDRAFTNHPKLTIPRRDPKSTHVFHQYTLVLNGVDRTALQAKLQEKGIASMIYYPVPMHMQKAYTDPRYKEGDFPITEELSRNVVSLPMHTELTDEQLAYITEGVLDALQNYNRLCLLSKPATSINPMRIIKRSMM
ncbi:MAG: DegT/DnrJ/EryC1/StrS family aminotransferase [Flavobacteriales bacterium]